RAAGLEYRAGRRADIFRNGAFRSAGQIDEEDVRGAVAAARHEVRGGVAEHDLTAAEGDGSGERARAGARRSVRRGRAELNRVGQEIVDVGLLLAAVGARHQVGRRARERDIAAVRADL